MSVNPTWAQQHTTDWAKRNAYHSARLASYFGCGAHSTDTQKSRICYTCCQKAQQLGLPESVQSRLLNGLLAPRYDRSLFERAHQDYSTAMTIFWYGFGGYSRLGDCSVSPSQVY